MSASRSLAAARARSRPLGPSAAALGVAIVALAAATWAARRAGGSVVPGGLVDECAHLLSTLLVCWALGRALCERFLVPALIASVAIDVDHVPDRLGSDWLTAGTARPYPHSLLAIIAVLLASMIWRHRRDLFAGVALGLGLHLWWDAVESKAGVPLLWPFSDHAFTLPFEGYVFPMILVLGVDAYRVRARSAGQREGR